MCVCMYVCEKGLGEKEKESAFMKLTHSIVWASTNVQGRPSDW